jgi:hypothetical protein
MIALTTMGMFIHLARAIENDRLEEALAEGEAALLLHGLDNSGVFALLFDLNNILERGIGAGAYTAIGAGFGRPYESKGLAATLMGPTGEFLDSIGQLLGHGVGYLAGEKVSEARANSDKRKVLNLLPGATLPYVRMPMEYGIMPERRQ